MSATISPDNLKLAGINVESLEVFVGQELGRRDAVKVPDHFRFRLQPIKNFLELFEGGVSVLIKNCFKPKLIELGWALQKK